MPMIPLPPRTTFALSTSSLNLNVQMETPAHFDQVIAALTTMRGLFVEGPPKPLGSFETGMERSTVPTPAEVARAVLLERRPPPTFNLTEDLLDQLVERVLAAPAGEQTLEQLADDAWKGLAKGPLKARVIL